MYLLFGFLTTVVGWSVYYLILLGGRAVLGIPVEETTTARYFILYTAAQIIQWTCAGLFAFFTNRAWVFTKADKSVSVWKQFITFIGGRVVTLGIDYVITFGVTLLLVSLVPMWTAVTIFGATVNLCELFSKFLASVAVIISNYIVSKWFVFKNKKEN